MSRIHEALKKAEEERSSAPPVETVPSIEREAAVVAPVWPEHSLNASGNAAAESKAANSPTEHLRFDELLARCAHPQWHMDPNVNVFSNPQLSPHGAEQFRTLRSRLYQLRTSQALRTVLITSAVPTEGKTFVTSNLAQAIVRQPDRRVLIIDADLRRPRLHAPFDAPITPGLSDYLRGEADEVAVIQQGQEGNLCLIPGGGEVSNPSELLSNGRLKKLLDRLTPVFDWILLDSPPCVPVADATILADLCDGVLLVVRAGSTPFEVAQRACHELEGKNVIGVVLNAAEQSHMYGSHYYYGYGNAYPSGTTESGDRKVSL
jgi:protein-tyrosine kinase